MLIVWKLSEMYTYQGLWRQGCVIKAKKSNLDIVSKVPFFLAPQTEIPLTGEMSRSDKRVTARYEQLEPVDDVVVQK